MSEVKIAGYSIEITHADIQACKSVNDLKKLNIFTGGNDEAYEELFKLVKPAKTEKAKQETGSEE